MAPYLSSLYLLCLTLLQLIDILRLFLPRPSCSRDHPSPRQDTEREDDSPKYVALYDYETPIVGYLSFKRGDKMTLLEATYESWWKMKLQAPSRKSSSDPREGYVPCNYIAALENLRDEP